MGTKKIPEYKHDVWECLSKIIKKAKEVDKTIEDVDVECSTLQRLDFKEPTKFKTGQPIKIYRITKSGNPKATRSFISHNFCPFCGKKF